MKSIHTFTDYAPDGVDLSNLGGEKYVPIENLIFKEVLEKDYLSIPGVQEFIRNNTVIQNAIRDFVSPEDAVFSNMYGNDAEVAMESLQKRNKK